MTKGLLVVLSGPSGVGKGTVLGRLLQEDSGCVLSVSATTRSPRPGEEEGRSYYFLTREQFGEMVARGEMLEYAEFSGNCYGTPRDPVERLRDRGKHVILEIEVQGAMQVKRLCPDAVFIFIAPPNRETLRERLAGRGTEDQPTLARRLAAAEEELARAEEYDYIIVNDDIEDCLDQLRAVIKAAACRAENRRELIREVCRDA